ncbi:MAG: FlgD immunoglobulin-like domain containing protein [Reichenbachiella sp.]|uniref:FlgD immunoglobulin-like domain containing protein n=1 Tax=Reichenbachiella sp. TaxID=2184521 RepID=UPI00326460EC
MRIVLKILGVLTLFTTISCNQNTKKPVLPELPGIKSAIGSKEKPRARFDYKTKMLVDPRTDEIPFNIHRDELTFSRSIQNSTLSNQRRESLEWTTAGPNNVGGRTRALAIDDRDEDIILAGGVSGGVWRSLNGGLSWTRTTQPTVLNSVTCIAQDNRTGKRDTWYFGTGELRGNSARAPGALYRGDGIFKSVDNGASWDILPATSTNQAASFDSPFNYVWNLATDPTSDFGIDEIYAALYGNIVRSTDGGNNWVKVHGEPNLLEDNSGNLNNSGASFYTNILITPSGDKYAYLSTSTGTGFNGTDKGIFYSTDGTNWTNITPPGFINFSERLVMAYAPSDDDILYFLVEGTSLQLWKYENSIWSNRSMQVPDDTFDFEAFDSQSSYNLTIKVHPSNPNIVYIGGTNLYRSTDGFTTRSNVSQIGGYAIEDESLIYENHHPDQHELVFLEDADQMLTANDGGVFKTFDNRSANVSWVSLNQGYITSQFYTIALSKVEQSSRTIGGLQDNGSYLKFENSVNSDWTEILGGDGSFCASTPADLYWYASFQEAGIFKVSYDSDGDLSTWAEVDPKGISRDNYLFVTPFVLDPNNYNRMYLAGDSAIWRNNNLTQISLFTQNTTTTNWDVIDPISDPEDITALEISTNPAHILYYGTSNGNVYKITSANQPTPDTEQIFSHQGYVANISINPNNADQLLVCYSNYNIPSLFYTEDGGENFVDVGGNLEENDDGSGNGPSIRWSEIIPLNNEEYFYMLGTSTGLYSTEELIEGQTVWQPEGLESIGHSVVSMIDYRSTDGKIVVATHGNGVFESSLANTEEIVPAVIEKSGIQLASGFPNPFTEEFQIRFTISEAGPLALHISDVSGRIIRTILNTPQFAGDISITWDAKNNSGDFVANGLYQYLIIYEGQSCGGNVILNR